MVPEWVLDADIGDRALRLYAVLLRYGNTTGARMPARSTLAHRLHKKSVDTVDRALAELVLLGAARSSTAGPAVSGSPTGTGSVRRDPALTVQLEPCPRSVSGRWPHECGHLCWVGSTWPHGCGYPHGYG